MEPALVPEFDPWDLDRLRLPANARPKRRESTRPPRHRPGEPFLKGPIAYPWISAACRLPGSGLRLATAVRFLCNRYRGENRWGMEKVAAGVAISERAARRALHAAEEAGLLYVRREPGCKLSASVLDLASPEPGAAPRALRGPIPWDWWLTALRLPGPALQVASACWLTAGWANARRFELALGAWSDLGLSRSAASRGLDSLASARILSVLARAGRSPIVELQAVTEFR